MVDISRYVDTSESLPTVRTKSLVAALSGTVLLGYWYGLVDMITAFGGGVSGTLDGFETWLSARLIPASFDVVESPLDEAARANAEFLDLFGPFAQAAAVVEVLVVVGILAWGMSTALRILGGRS